MTGRLLAVVIALCAFAAAPARAVVGGTPATQAYPWMASLQVGESHTCGGSLIRPDIVLTAAHCVAGEQRQDLSVVLGRTRLSADAGERIPAKSVEIDEAYATDPNGGHDIALVRLKRASKAETVDVVAPAQDTTWLPGRPVRVIGWGSAVFAVGPGSDELLQADVEVISDADCNASYNGLVNHGFDPATMLCAGRRVVGLEDACQGDSGGPLVARTAEGWVLVGTVSAGLGCGFPLFYGIYGRLGSPALRDWLTTHIGTSAPARPTPVAEPSDVELTAVRVRVTRRKVKVRVTASAPVTAVKATLRRGGEVFARGGLPRIRKAGTVALALRPTAPRRARLWIRATDGGGRAVTLRRPVALRR